jgi:type I restriction-modification system DNA methylase subunit
VLRDLYVRGKYRDVILPMTVLRRLDAVLEPTKQAVIDMKASLDKAKIAHQDQAIRQAAGQAFYNTSKFTLRDLKLITVEIPAKVAADTAYQNAMKNSDKQNARIEHDGALARVMTAVLKDDTELFKLFSDDPAFRRWLTDTIFSATYAPPRK